MSDCNPLFLHEAACSSFCIQCFCHDLISLDQKQQLCCCLCVLLLFRPVAPKGLDWMQYFLFLHRDASVCCLYKGCRCHHVDSLLSISPGTGQAMSANDGQVSAALLHVNTLAATPLSSLCDQAPSHGLCSASEEIASLAFDTGHEFEIRQHLSVHSSNMCLEYMAGRSLVEGTCSCRNY